MRFPKAITTVALFGASCVGKSTVAKELAKLLKWPVRHCGDIVKQRAKQLDCPLGDLPVLHHKEIDQQTCEEVKSPHSGLIVEGRFLDKVLAGAANVILVQLTCKDSERNARAQCDGRTRDFIAEQDANSAFFCAQVYPGVIAAEPFLKLATDGMSPSALANRIVERLHLR